MKKTLFTVIALIAFTLSASAADNAANKTVSVQGKARIITPITLSNNQALDFGVIARGTGNSTIVVGAVETPTISVPTGDAVVLTSSAQTSAKFTVGGETSKSYNITIPSTPQVISDGTNNLSITAFTCSNSLTNSVIGTNDVFYVGGTLTVPSTAVAASYTGTFSVTVAYN
ncbi:MAG TPA: DUF4402 domain-containing protein [Bacteroidales bacterium]|nr:DUF4402 domain-containing protein [Bacteroidales bacterium]